MVEKTGKTLEEILGFNNEDSEDFFKAFYLGFVLGDSLAKAFYCDGGFVNPKQFEERARVLLAEKVGKKIPGTQTFFTKEIIDAVIIIFNSYPLHFITLV